MRKKSRLMLTISNNSNKNETKRSLYPEKNTVKRTVKQAFKIRFI